MLVKLTTANSYELVARPLTDDFTIISHLHTRYKVTNTRYSCRPC